MAKRKSWSGLDPRLLKKSRRSNFSSVVVKGGKNSLPSVVIAYPGCDFEVIVVNEVAVAFRHGDVRKRVDPDDDDQHDMRIPLKYWDMISGIESLPPAEFNAALVDHLAVALKQVANGPQVVETASHFTGVISKAIEELDAVTKKGYRKIDSIKNAIFDVKQRLFSRMMSKDLRRQ